MRISTLQFTQNAINSISRQQVELSRIQQQIASGKNILTPSDDPAGAGRILTLNQSLQTTEQFTDNANLALGRLQLEESTLSSVTSVIQRIRELSVQANNDTQNNTTRPLIAAEIRQRRDELLALANTRDANGEYIFAGFQSQNEAFTRNPDNTFSYNGDEGQRFLQVGPSRQVAIGDSGRDVFGLVRNGNGTFATSDVTGNTGSGVIGPGTITDRSAYTGGNYAVSLVNNSSGELAYNVVQTRPAIAVTQNDSIASGAFVPFVPGGGETYSLTVDGVNIFSQTAGGAIVGSDIDDGITTNAAALAAAGISTSGSAAAGTLVFSRVDGAAFDIEVTDDAGTGAFSSADFSAGTNTINNGNIAVAAALPVPAVQNTSVVPGSFTTFTPANGDDYSITVDGISVFTFTGDGVADVDAADIDGGFAAASAALTAAGITVTGSAAVGNLQISRADGAAFDIDIVDDSGAGGFLGGDVITGTNTVDNGQEATPPVQNDSGASGSFTGLTPGAGETYSLTVDGVPIFTQTAGGAIADTDIDGAILAAAGALATAGITVTGQAQTNDLVFSRADGAAFDIVVVNDTGADGFGGATDFATGTNNIDNGNVELFTVQNDSFLPGSFSSFTPAGGDTYSITVDGVAIFSQTGGGVITAAAIDGAIVAATTALNGAGVTVTGSATVGNLVFSRADGASFDIDVVDDAAVGGFIGGDFTAAGSTVNNGSEAVPGTYTQIIPTPPADITDAAPAFSSGASIAFAGLQFDISGSPAVGDGFTVSPSTNQDIFTTTQNLIDALETPADDAGDRAAFHNAINRVLGNLDQAFNKVNEVRAEVGSRLNLIDNQLNLNEAATLQAQTTLSSIQDLDFADAVSQLQLQTTSLQAAQQSFLRIQGLSLFNFLS